MPPELSRGRIDWAAGVKLSKFSRGAAVPAGPLQFRPNEPYGFRGRKAILNHAHALVSTACPYMSIDTWKH